MTLEVKPIKILDRSEKELRNKKVALVKILWRNSQMEEDTWERESEMKRKYPNLFIEVGKKFKFHGLNFIRRGECETLKNKIKIKIFLKLNSFTLLSRTLNTTVRSN